MADDLHLHDLDLTGRWRAEVADEDLRRKWQTDDFDDTAFAEITVPGHWRRTETFATSDGPVLYRRRFQSLTQPRLGRAWLVFDGLCAQGDIWLDGAYLGDSEGAFTAHRFEVTDALTARHEHVLGVEVTSPKLTDRAQKRGLTGTWQDGPYVTPGWNPGGLWGGVRIHRTGPIALTACRVLCTEATSERAVVSFRASLDALAPGPVTLRTTVGARDDAQVRALAAGTNIVTWSVPIADPTLWWPYELGGQSLVDVTVEVVVDDVEDVDGPATGGPIISDRFSTTTGLRSVHLHEWVLRVNGERLFLKGVVTGPASETLGTAPADVFEEQVTTAREAGLNLLRVHGHRSRPELYDAADRAGMLIWQDLPLYRGLHRSVRHAAVRVAESTVDDLGAHPSIVLWCGHDEPDDAQPDAPTPRQRRFGKDVATHLLPNWNRSVLDRTVRRTLVAADPTRPTVASSGVWPHPPGLDGTDVHLSLGWEHGEADDLVGLARAIPRAVRFVQITPNPSLPLDAAFCEPDRWPEIDVERLADEHGIDPALLEQRLPPDAFATFDEWQAATRNYQAHLVRTQVEALRRLKYRPTGGFLVAYLRDLRPDFSPSLVDVDGQLKPAFEALQAATSTVLATLDRWPSCLHPGETFSGDVHVISDLRSPVADARCRISARWEGGARDWEFAGDLEPDSCALVGSIAFAVPDGTDYVTVSLSVEGDGRGATNAYSSPVHAEH